VILIVALPRSGTKFISTLFIEHGLDVRHEVWGKDGIAWFGLASCCNFWRGFEFCPPETRRRHPVVHQVRHPLGVIGSLATFSEEALRQIERSIPLRPANPHPLIRYMHVYLCYNRLAQGRACYTYRVENIRQEFDVLCRMAGFDATLKPDFITSEQTHARPHRAVSWADLEKADASLASEVQAMAVGYGYTT